MSVFRFKKFEIRNERSPMKVNTDGVLLGAAVTLTKDIKKAVDVGTGTGTVALMVAQRLSEMGMKDFSVLGVDIDSPSAEEASENFAASPWKGNLSAELAALSELERRDSLYDLIVSNPPYFDNSLHNPDERKNTARHTSEGGLSYRTLIEYASKKLTENGLLSMILPYSDRRAILRYAASFGLYPSRILSIRTTERKEPSRMIAEFSLKRADTLEEDLIIYKNGAASEEYRSITNQFYINQ